VRPQDRKALRLHVEVAASPTVGLLRPAIAARLSGRPFVPGPEDEIARAVAAAVAAERAQRSQVREGSWR
jgi:hypothetical protein